MRAFIAAPLPQHVLDLILNIQNELSKKPIHQTITQHPHLTFIFLDEQTDEQITQLQLKLAQFHIPPTTTHLGRIATFDHQKTPRVIHITLEPAQQLINIHTQLLKHINRPANKTTFIPHITLSRVKQWNPHTRLDIQIPTIPFEINQLILYKSELTPHGPIYTELARTPKAL